MGSLLGVSVGGALLGSLLGVSVGGALAGASLGVSMGGVLGGCDAGGEEPDSGDAGPAIPPIAIGPSNSSSSMTRDRLCSGAAAAGSGDGAGAGAGAGGAAAAGASAPAEAATRMAVWQRGHLKTRPCASSGTDRTAVHALQRMNTLGLPFLVTLRSP